MTDQTLQKRALAMEVKNEVRQFVEAYQRLVALRERYSDLGVTYTDEDFASDGLEHITASNFTNALSTVDQLKTLMDSGHRSNFNRIV